jgi:hypothetical protein
MQLTITGRAREPVGDGNELAAVPATNGVQVDHGGLLHGAWRWPNNLTTSIRYILISGVVVWLQPSRYLGAICRRSI